MQVQAASESEVSDVEKFVGDVRRLIQSTPVQERGGLRYTFHFGPWGIECHRHATSHKPKLLGTGITRFRVVIKDEGDDISLWNVREDEKICELRSRKPAALLHEILEAAAAQKIQAAAEAPSQKHSQKALEFLQDLYIDPARLKPVPGQRGVYDYDGHVHWNGKKLKKLPIRFRHVSGSFCCHDNSLTSLNGAPETVGGRFNCARNALTSLEGSPKTVFENFYCHENYLTSLRGSPEKVGGHFHCEGNLLTSLEGAPESVGRNFFCEENRLPSSTRKPAGVKGRFYFPERSTAAEAAAEVPAHVDIQELFVGFVKKLRNNPNVIVSDSGVPGHAHLHSVFFKKIGVDVRFFPSSPNAHPFILVTNTQKQYRRLEENVTVDKLLRAIKDLAVAHVTGAAETDIDDFTAYVNELTPGLVNAKTVRAPGVTASVYRRPESKLRLFIWLVSLGQGAPLFSLSKNKSGSLSVCQESAAGFPEIATVKNTSTFLDDAVHAALSASRSEAAAEALVNHFSSFSSSLPKGVRHRTRITWKDTTFLVFRSEAAAGLTIVRNDTINGVFEHVWYLLKNVGARLELWRGVKGKDLELVSKLPNDAKFLPRALKKILEVGDSCDSVEAAAEVPAENEVDKHVRQIYEMVMRDGIDANGIHKKLLRTTNGPLTLKVFDGNPRQLELRFQGVTAHCMSLHNTLDVDIVYQGVTTNVVIPKQKSSKAMLAAVVEKMAQERSPATAAAEVPMNKLQEILDKLVLRIRTHTKTLDLKQGPYSYAIIRYTGQYFEIKLSDVLGPIGTEADPFYVGANTDNYGDNCVFFDSVRRHRDKSIRSHVQVPASVLTPEQLLSFFIRYCVEVATKHPLKGKE